MYMYMCIIQCTSVSQTLHAQIHVHLYLYINHIMYHMQIPHILTLTLCMHLCLSMQNYDACTLQSIIILCSLECTCVATLMYFVLPSLGSLWCGVVGLAHAAIGRKGRGTGTNSTRRVGRMVAVSNL